MFQLILLVTILTKQNKKTFMKKLKLSELKVQSFVTSLEDAQKMELNGGQNDTVTSAQCGTFHWTCTTNTCYYPCGGAEYTYPGGPNGQTGKC